MEDKIYYEAGDHNHYYHEHKDELNAVRWTHAHCARFPSCHEYVGDFHHVHREDGSIKLRIKRAS